MITEDPSIIIGYKKAILTPNKVEFERLFEKIVSTYLYNFHLYWQFHQKVLFLSTNLIKHV